MTNILFIYGQEVNAMHNCLHFLAEKNGVVQSDRQNSENYTLRMGGANDGDAASPVGVLSDPSVSFSCRGDS